MSEKRQSITNIEVHTLSCTFYCRREPTSVLPRAHKNIPRPRFRSTPLHYSDGHWQCLGFRSMEWITQDIRGDVGTNRVMIKDSYVVKAPVSPVRCCCLIAREEKGIRRPPLHQFQQDRIPQPTTKAPLSPEQQNTSTKTNPNQPPIAKMKFSAVALFALGASAAAAPANMHKANKMDMEHMEHMDKMISRSTDMNEDMDHIANVKMEMGKAFLSNKEVESLGAMLRKLLGMHEEDAPEGHEGKGYTKRTAMHASFTLRKTTCQ